jgi:hypothetical protein
VTANKAGGSIQQSNPITVKNQIQEIRSVDNIPGVNTSLREDGSTLIYNATTGQYDVKILETVPSAGYADAAGIAFSAYSADSLGGRGWESPGRIGSQIPSTGNFTNLNTDNLYVNGVSVFASLLIDGGGF